MKQIRKRILSSIIAMAIILTDSNISIFANDTEIESLSNNEISEPTEISEPYITGELTDLRSEYSKTYEKSDGSRVSVVSALPLHYYNDENNTWEDYNNTLSKVTNGKDEDILTNDNSEFKVELPAILNEYNDINIKSNDYEVSILPLEVSETNVKEDNEISETKNAEEMTVEDYVEESIVSPTVTYENAYNDASLEYEVANTSLKETITLSKKSEAETSYSFEIKSNDLNAELKNDGTILLKNEDKTVFVIPAPFMTDSDNNFSDDIKTKLIKENNKYILTYIPSIEWLSDEERAYPVSIDPTVTLSDSNNIEDAYVTSAYPSKNYGNNTALFVGKIPNERASVDEYLSYMKFKNLPKNIWNNSYITKATLNLNVFNVATSPIYLHKVKSNWKENAITYNNKPDTSSEVIDYENVARDNSGYHKWDITNLVEEWYKNPGTNYGVMLQSSSTNVYPNMIYSSEYSEQKPVGYPYITIEYSPMTNAAYENSRDIDVGRAGTVNINDFTGNVRLTRTDLGVDGNIMPVNISMIYDKNIVNLPDNLNTDIYGVGFRTNYSQAIIYDSEKEYYTYIGEDARPIYFEKTENDGEINFVDNANRGYELSVSGSDYSDYTNVSITDENNYKYYFDETGRLIKIANMNLSIVKEANVTSTSTDTVNGIVHISYNSENDFSISQITDGVGRMYQFNYNNILSAIEYKGTGSDILKTVSYSYNADGTLASVTCPDNKIVNYEWAGNNLTKVVNTDGYSFSLTYTNDGTEKVQSINEYASDGTLGESISVSYSINKTIYTDNKTNEKEILQFDKYGNLLTAQNADGYTLVNQYGNSDLNSETKAPNELINSFGYQKNEVNLLSNTRAQDGNTNWNGVQISSDEKIFGTKSFKLSGINSTAFQGVNLISGQTYVFSAYVKTKNVKGSKGATIKVNNANITLNSNAQYITGSSSWTRIATTFKANTSCLADMTLVLDNTNSLAEAYFDGIQLEKGTTVSEYNYVLNPDFIDNSNWNSNSIESQNAPEINSEKGLYSFVNEETPFDNNCVKLYGDARYTNSVYQQIMNINGQKGDTYNFGGWAKALASGLRDNRTFGLKVEFYNDTTLVGEASNLSFNSYINDWQFNMSSAVASDNYTSIVISAVYDYQVNYALFDRILLQYAGITDTEDSSDDESSDDSTSDESSEADPSVKDEHGREIEYTDEDGVKTITDYDDYDNVTRSATQINGKIMESLNGYTSDGNYQTSETNALGKTTSYNYDNQLGLLEKVTDPNGISTEYSYDAVGNINSVSSGMSCYYPYDNGDRVTGLNSFIRYNIGYDKFGALSNINYEDQSLVKYSYDDNYILSKADYGNGQTVNYNYDESGNKLGIGYDGSEKYSYYYDDFGTLLSLKDNVNNIVTSYSTDEDGVEYTQERIKDTLVHSYYIKNESLIEYLNGMEKETIHTSKESSEDDTEPLISWNRTSWKKNGYDSFYNIKDTTDEFGRLSTHEIYEAKLSDDKQTESNKDTLIRKSYDYNTTNGGVNQSEQVSKIKYEGVYNNEINYTYDENGNILTDGTYEYTYDSDNRLTYARELDSGNYTNYIYNSVGVLVAAIKFKGGRVVESISRDYDAVKLIEFNGHEITYDAIGNPLTYYNGAQFTWQMGRQLASAQMSDGTQISYKYNADGIRTEKKINDTTTTYTLIGSKITGQTDGTNTFYFRYDENDNLIGFELGNKQYFYITNLVGDIVAIVDSDGAAVVKYEYDPWGVCTIVSDTSNCNLGKLNPFRYRGYYYDEETSLYYLQSRYYDPATQRFINADDPNMLLADCYNPNVIYRWDYCNNNPVMFVDKDGYIAANVVGAVIGSIVGAVGGYVLTNWLANKIGLKGWKRNAFVWGLSAVITASAAAIGYVIGPYVAKVVVKLGNYVSSLIKNGKIKLKKLSSNAKSSIRKILKESCCFVAGTLISTPEGKVPIEEITVGDYVYSENPETGDKEINKVTNTFVRETKTVYKIITDSDSITTTYEHPFWVENKGWVEAHDLEIGNSLRLKNNQNTIVKEIIITDFNNPIKVYNFEVENFHTYFVGSTEILVHNKCSLTKISDKYLKNQKLDAHAIKKEVLGKNAKISLYDLYYDKSSKAIFILRKGAKDIERIATGYFLK